jgi:hypothetical protein
MSSERNGPRMQMNSPRNDLSGTPLRMIVTRGRA